MSDSESEQRQESEEEINLPKYSLRYNELTMSQLIVVLQFIIFKVANQAMIDPSNTYDKDIAKTVAYLCKSDPKLCDIGEGEWQCVYGSHFTGSLTFDSHLVTFIDFPNRGKTLLVFKG